MSDAKEVTGRDLAKKMYKILKKKRARAKKAQLKSLQPKNPDTKDNVLKPLPPDAWKRVMRGASNPKATNRPVDNVEEIEKLLQKRSKAKLEKNYAVADELAATLVAMEIFYNEDRKEWHTRPLLTQEQKDAQKRKEAGKRQRGPSKSSPAEPTPSKKAKLSKKNQKKKA